MKVPDFEAEVVANFLAYLYSDKVDVEMAKQLQSALNKVAELEAELNRTGYSVRDKLICNRRFDEGKLCPNLLKMADYYQVQDLRQDCIEYLKRKITRQNVVASWKAALACDSEDLKNVALKFLVKVGSMRPLLLDIPGMEMVYQTPAMVEQLLKVTFEALRPGMCSDCGGIDVMCIDCHCSQ